MNPTVVLLRNDNKFHGLWYEVKIRWKLNYAFTVKLILFCQPALLLFRFEHFLNFRHLALKEEIKKVNKNICG